MSDVHRTYQRRSRDEWAQLVAEQQQSGLSQQAFCEQRGVVLSSFRNWKRRLADAPTADRRDAGGNWLELPVRLSDKGTVGWDIELELGDGLCLRLRRS